MPDFARLMLTQAGVNLCSNFYLPIRARRWLKLPCIARGDVDVEVEIRVRRSCMLGLDLEKF